MSFHERRALVASFSAVIVPALYAAYMMQQFPQVDPYAPQVLRYWGGFFLGLVVVTIVAKIIIHIVFSILNTIASREAEPNIVDERDKLIELKASTNGGYVFGIGFVLAMVTLLLDQPPSLMFSVLLVTGVVTDLTTELAHFYFYRRGF